MPLSKIARPNRRSIPLSHALALRLDASRLMLDAGLVPDPWQRDLLRSTADRILMLNARQTGKSTATAGLALHHAMSTRSALVLLLAPTLRQSHELFLKVMHLRARLPYDIPLAHESSLSLEFENGSRIVCLPGTEATVRGYSGVTLLIIDEAARVDDELYYSVRPMLAVSAGRLICLTTPSGKRGWFFEEWIDSPEWQRIKVTAPECSRISKQFLDQERRTLGAAWYGQRIPLRVRIILLGSFRSRPGEGCIRSKRATPFSQTWETYWETYNDIFVSA